MMELTLVEAKMLEALRLALEYLTRKDVRKGEYLFLMETVSKAIQAGKNKQGGCPSGLHTSYCNCTSFKPGQSVTYEQYRKREV